MKYNNQNTDKFSNVEHMLYYGNSYIIISCIFDDYQPQPCIIMYMIFLLNSSISVIEYNIQAISFLLFLACAHCSYFFVTSFTSCVTDDYQFQQYIIMHSIMHQGLYCR